MNPAAVILAAGESRRMGRAKAFLPFRDGTFLSVVARTMETCCRPVVAVFGFDGDSLAGQAPAGVVPVVNHNYKLGMLTSLQCGLRALGAISGPVLFTLVDHPAVQPGTVRLLAETDARIAIPRHEGKRGHPVRLDSSMAREFLAEPSTSKVRDLIDRNKAFIRYVDVPDCGINDDVDDPALYQALLAREAAGL